MNDHTLLGLPKYRVSMWRQFLSLQKESNELITIEAKYTDVYLDYEIYTLFVKNNTEQTILLDTREKAKTTYITDSNHNNFEAFLYENAQQDLMFEPQELKTIQIKFNDSYHGNMDIASINFVDIVNYDKYTQDSNTERYTLEIER